MADKTFDPTKTRIVALATETDGYEPSLPPELVPEVLEFGSFLIRDWHWHDRQDWLSP